jgi:LPPG:FO 2-phospho-L-lactate transferase
MPGPSPESVVALAGGVGAARLLTGVCAVVDPARITAVVNTGDDLSIHGLTVCPDLDTVTYTLAGETNPETGWGRAGETWHAMAELRACSGGRLGWFNLGDRDLGLHLYRTTRLAEGASLTEVTAEITARFELDVRLLPMADRRVATRVTLAEDGQEVEFQEYFVRLGHEVAVSAVRFDGVEGARAGPGVLEAIAGAGVVVICPSNPIVSIGPVLAVHGIADSVTARRDHTVAVSPIVAGRALKGPADRLLSELGHEPSVVGVARLWAPFAASLVIDEADANLSGAVEAEGVRCIVAPTVMSGPAEAANLARVVLEAGGNAGGSVSEAR